MSETFCAACPVTQGMCPNCGTFWIPHYTGKRIGVRPTDHNPYASYIDKNGNTVFPVSPPIDGHPVFGYWPNVIVKPAPFYAGVPGGGRQEQDLGGTAGAVPGSKGGEA